MERGTWSSCRLPQAELDSYLREDTTRVLFDGLDEIFDESLRGNIVAEIISFARQYPRVQVLVTTRVVGYAIGSPNPEHFKSAGFRQFTLQDFEDEQVNEFIAKWYRASLSDTREITELSERLVKVIFESRHFANLQGPPYC